MLVLACGLMLSLIMSFNVDKGIKVRDEKRVGENRESGYRNGDWAYIGDICKRIQLRTNGF